MYQYLLNDHNECNMLTQGVVMGEQGSEFKGTLLTTF
jgi:hypothetical protein